VIFGSHSGSQDLVNAFMITTAHVDQERILEILIGDHRKSGLRQVVVDVGVHPWEQMAEGRQLRVRLESQPPRSWHEEAGLIGIMRHDEQPSEGDIQAHDPLGILEEDTVHSLSDGLRSPLIGLDEDSPVHLIVGQRVYSLLQAGDDIADCRCWLAGAALGLSKGIVHSASLAWQPFND
jgi:hypothetical protein